MIAEPVGMLIPLPTKPATAPGNWSHTSAGHGGAALAVPTPKDPAVPTRPAVSAAPATAPPAARVTADFSRTVRCLPVCITAVINVSVPFVGPGSGNHGTPAVQSALWLVSHESPPCDPPH